MPKKSQINEYSDNIVFSVVLWYFMLSYGNFFNKSTFLRKNYMSIGQYPN